jgi:protein-L-isoaspartate(D-aspartate) O-methyltransferase
MRLPETNDELIELVRHRAGSYIGRGERDPRVLDAMRAIDRAAFLPAGARYAAYLDEAADIGLGQTCSQPSMVAFMLDKLDIRPASRVLEVGAGCGYAAALIALLCAPGGSVVAAEIESELASSARVNCAMALAAAAPLGWASAATVELVAADASDGLPERAPFDRILLSAGVRSRSFSEEPLLAQLAEGGVLVYPEARGRLYRMTRRKGRIVRESWAGVAFVDLRGRNS